MYGIFTNIYPINEPNVGKYTIHGASGIYIYIHMYIYIYVYIIVCRLEFLRKDLFEANRFVSALTAHPCKSDQEGGWSGI